MAAGSVMLSWPLRGPRGTTADRIYEYGSIISPGRPAVPVPLTFVLGGARSGKSRYAESMVVALPPPWAYVATAEAGDEEMAARIKAHRERRGAAWQTIEAPRALAPALAARGTMPVMVDCLTLWLSNLMLADAAIEEEIHHLEEALAAAAGPVVLVANEVG